MQAYGQHVTDDTGGEIELTTPPQRIITLAPELAELLFAFGCGQKIVGVSQFTNYPPEAAKLPIIGAYTAPSLESIAALKPDLILATGNGNPKETVLRLRGLGYPIYTYYPKTMEEYFPAMERLGRVAGCGDSAMKIVTGLRTRFEAIKSQNPPSRPSVILLYNHDPLIAAGRETIFHHVLEWVGARNILADDAPRYPRISMETLLSRQPDIILLAIQAPGMKEATPEYWASYPLKAAKHGNILALNPDLVSRAGPRLIEVAEVLKTALDKAMAPESP